MKITLLKKKTGKPKISLYYIQNGAYRRKEVFQHILTEEEINILLHNRPIIKWGRFYWTTIGYIKWN